MLQRPVAVDWAVPKKEFEEKSGLTEKREVKEEEEEDGSEEEGEAEEVS